MIRKPEDLPENATDKHFAEECCRYEQTPANSGSVWRCLSSALVGLHGVYSIPGMAGFCCARTPGLHLDYARATVVA